MTRTHEPVTEEGASPMPHDPAELADAYFSAWQAHDWATLRSILTGDATFRGPLGTADDADSCVAGLQGMARTMVSIDVQARVADESDVITWFDLHTSVAPPTPVANWMHVRDGRIAAIRVTFDPRRLLAGLDRPSEEKAG